MIEIEDNMDKETIYFLTETHKRDNSIRIKDDTKCIHKTREIDDKKGGGLMMLWKSELEMKSREVSNKIKDILITENIIGRYKFYSVLVYMSVTDYKLNQEIMREIVRLVNNVLDKDIIVLGDFNAHIEIIGYQKLNKNGEIILNILEKSNLVMLNLDEIKTTGTVTWQRGNQKSTIDYVLTNFSMFDKIRFMKIDEDQDEIAISNLNLIYVNIEIRNERKKKTDEYIEYNYFRLSEDRTEKLITSIKNNLQELTAENMENFEEFLRETCEKELKVSVRKKKLSESKTEPRWFNKTIRKEISNKRNINKQIRKSNNNTEQDSLKEVLKVKKSQIKSLVHTEVTKHEKKVSKDIIDDKNGNKRLYEHINQLKGEDKKQNKIIVYNEIGEKLDGQELKNCLKDRWQNIMGATQNQSHEEWNIVEKERYNRILNQETIRLTTRRDNMVETVIDFNAQLREHMDYAFSIVGNIISKMKKVKISVEDVKRQINKMKKNKAPGPDTLRIEIYKALIEEEEIISMMCILMNKVLETGQVPANWKTSKTVLLEKKKRPTIEDLRPIALTNCSYKILMGILKQKIEEHLFKNDVVEECQSGSTKGRRVQDNLKILQYCIEKSFKNKMELYVLAIDFKKAFDSVDRKMLLNILKKYKIEPRVIDIIYEIYRDDSTKLFINNEECASINVETGIRQGCSCSGLLFVMVTYFIIGKLQQSGLGYRDSEFSIPSLFYADDGLILAHSRQDLVKLIKIVEDSSAQCGLELNREKCKIITFNNKDTEEVGGIKIVQELKYLGVTIENKRRWYGKHIADNMNKGTRLANYMYSIIGGSCNKLMIGKTFWKVLALSSILFNQEILLYNASEMDKLQRIENKAYRSILNLPIYTATEFLRGEIGSSTIIARDMKNKLSYYKYAMCQTNNSLLKEIVEMDAEYKTEWYKKIRSYMDKLRITQGQLFSMSKEQIKKKIDEWDTEQWREAMESKSTLGIYRQYKTNIKEEKWFLNNNKANIMMKARSNTLKLSWREFGTESAKICKLCGEEIETLEHFLLYCDRLQEVRSGYLELQRPVVENKTDLMASILLLESGGGGRTEYYMELLWSLWRKREMIMDELERMV